MTVNSFSSPDPGSPSPNQDRRRNRRRWLIGGTVALALAIVGAAAVYAGTMLADDDRSADAAAEPGAEPRSAPPLIPPDPPSPGPSTDQGWAFCMEVQSILSDEFVDLDVDFVESRRAAADRLRHLVAPSSTHRVALDELADELIELAEIVEEDPAAEAEASERSDEAVFEFIDDGGCDGA
jgi:hypothetical protein